MVAAKANRISLWHVCGILDPKSGAVCILAAVSSLGGQPVAGPVADAN